MLGGQCLDSKYDSTKGSHVDTFLKSLSNQKNVKEAIKQSFVADLQNTTTLQLLQDGFIGTFEAWINSGNASEFFAYT